MHIGALRTGILMVYPILDDVDGSGLSLTNWVLEKHGRPDVMEDWNRKGDLVDIEHDFDECRVDGIDIPALFREAGVQVQVLEVGLGGRLDAVNIVDADAALITNIGLDHTDWLGKDRESIGREKAGIMRAGRPAIYVEADMPESVEDHAESIGAKLLQLGGDFWFVADESGHWHWRQGDVAIESLPPPALQGAMQYRNAAGVLAAVPTAIAAYIMVMNPAYLTGMWNDPSGRNWILFAIALQLTGIAIIWRMMRSI